MIPKTPIHIMIMVTIIGILVAKSPIVRFMPCVHVQATRTNWFNLDFNIIPIVLIITIMLLTSHCHIGLIFLGIIITILILIRRRLNNGWFLGCLACPVSLRWC